MEERTLLLEIINYWLNGKKIIKNPIFIMDIWTIKCFHAITHTDTCADTHTHTHTHTHRQVFLRVSHPLLLAFITGESCEVVALGGMAACYFTPVSPTLCAHRHTMP